MVLSTAWVQMEILPVLFCYHRATVPLMYLDWLQSAGQNVVLVV